MKIGDLGLATLKRASFAKSVIGRRMKRRMRGRRILEVYLAACRHPQAEGGFTEIPYVLLSVSPPFLSLSVSVSPLFLSLSVSVSPLFLSLCLFVVVSLPLSELN